jgi:hypothetical protein
MQLEEVTPEEESEEERLRRKNSQKEASPEPVITPSKVIEGTPAKKLQTDSENDKGVGSGAEVEEGAYFDIPSDEVKTPNILSDDNNNEEIILPELPPEKLPPIEDKRARELSYYATQELDVAETEFQESRNQLITEGRSDLVDRAKEQAKESDIDSDQLAIESVISDPNVPANYKKVLLKTYLTTGFFPISLKERYINNIATPDPTKSNASIEAQDLVLEQLFVRKNDQHIRSRDEQIEEISDGYLSAMASGFMTTFDQVGQTVGWNDMTLDDIKKDIDKTNNIANKSTMHAIMVGVGTLGPPLIAAGTGAIAAPLLGAGTLVSAGVAAGMTGVTEALARYSSLGAEEVEESIRLQGSIVSGTLLGAEVALPIIRSYNLAKNILFNGGGAIAISELSIYVQNALLEAYPELKQPQFELTNLTVNGLMGMSIGLIFGRLKRVKRLGEDDVGVPADSVADSQRVGNPEEAAEDAAKIIKNEDHTAAETKTGRGIFSYIHDWYMPKQHSIPKTGPDSLPPDAAAKLKEDMKMDEEEVLGHFDRRRVDPNVQNAQGRYDDIEVIVDIHKDKGGPKRHHSASSLEFLDDVSRGTDIYTPSRGGVYKTEKQAKIQMKKLQDSIDNSSAKDDGVVSLEARDGGFVIKWDWEKEYNPLSVGKMGVEDIRMFGDRLDVTRLARSWVGEFLFPTGKHKKMEGGAFRGIEHQAAIANAFSRIFNNAIRDLKLKKEFNAMIDHAESHGIDHFTISEIRTKFSVSRKEAQDLYVTWTKLRQVLDLEWNFRNRRDRNRKAADGMRGVYFQGEGKPLGMASEKISPEDLIELGKGNSYVWDYELNRKIKYNKKKFEAEDRKIVRLFEPAGGKGQSFRFGVLSSKVKLHHLPEITLPKVAGYMPRVTKENFFIDMIPKKSYIDGKLVTDPIILAKHLKTTKGAARTEIEGDEMAERLRLNNPDMIVKVRRDRLHTYDQETEAMKVRSMMEGESKRKGEWLDSLDGPARIEDRFVSIRKSFDNLATTEAFNQWDIAVQNSFMNRYKQFTRKGEFPSNKNDLVLPKGAERVDEIKFKEALRNFEYYYMMKQIKTSGDFHWEGLFHGIADLMEDIVPNKYARGASDMSRRLGNQGNIPVKISKQMASALYIHLNVPRQWIIQPQQAREMAFINPASADASVIRSMTMRALISTMDSSHNLNNSTLKILVGRTGLSEKALRDDFRAIKNSGMLDSLDRNELVRDTFNDVEALLVENGFQKAYRRTSNVISKPIGMARRVGFDAGEMSNRLGMWYQAKAIWQKKNPNKDWQSIEAQEMIALEGTKLSGGMSRAGSLPYQRGAVSIVMQFQAISHKLTMNLLQDRATILDGSQRAKVGALRFALYGFGSGVPGSAFMAYTYDVFTDDPLISDPKYRKIAENGVGNWLANKAIRNVFDEEGGPVTDINFSDGLSPYSPHLLPYVTTGMEVYKLFDGIGGTDPRFPIMGIKTAIGETASKIESHFHIKDISTPTLLIYAVHEVAQLTSGYKNLTKAIIMASTNQIQNKRGQDLGEAISISEAFAKAWGFRSNKEIDAWDGTLTAIQLAAVKKELAEDIYKKWVHIIPLIGTSEYDAQVSALSSLFTILDHSPHIDAQSKNDIEEMVMNMDSASHKSGKASLMAELWKHSYETITGDMKDLVEILERSENPKTIEWLEIWKSKEF